MANAEPVRVTIFNRTYSLRANQPAELTELAHQVDDQMRSIASQAGNADSTQVAVLACLHYADRLRELELEVDRLKSNVQTKAKQFSLLLDTVID
ncbi:MAG TPA: cell division protein ZapA [Bryobacteraceae bacterium]|nr:cell division protein ZapA [Bryobacteraceae bacterium]